MNDQKTTFFPFTGWRKPLALEAVGPSRDLLALPIFLQISELTLVAVCSLFQAIYSKFLKEDE